MNVKSKQNDGFKNVLPYIVLMLVIVVVLFTLNMQGMKVNKLSTGELISELKENNVSEITVTPKSDESVFYIEGRLEGYKSSEMFKAKAVGTEMENILSLEEQLKNLKRELK